MKKKKADNTILISFKISHELLKKLEAYAQTQVDEAGLPLSASLAARRLMLEGLKKLDKEK
jgi:hypothetical protein